MISAFLIVIALRCGGNLIALNPGDRVYFVIFFNHQDLRLSVSFIVVIGEIIVIIIIHGFRMRMRLISVVIALRLSLHLAMYSFILFTSLLMLLLWCLFSAISYKNKIVII